MAEHIRFLPVDMVTTAYTALSTTPEDEISSRVIRLMESAYARGYQEGLARGAVEQHYSSEARRTREAKEVAGA